MEQSLSPTDSSVFAKNLLATLESRLYRFDKCECIDDYTQLRFRDMIEFLVKKNKDGELTWFCDMGMKENDVTIHAIISRCLHQKSRISIASFE